ncbi:MAG: hypothetical protein COB13_001150 [OCS116 cluster bacterium]|nr:hypothetical protein [OCS116 cluster bacterium]
MMELEAFIVAAKAACYVGGGAVAKPCRTDAHDLSFSDGDWKYLDSYFGGSDFIGQEVVWYKDTAIWAMNYYGYIMQPALINAQQAGGVIKNSLSLLYAKNRFLGGFEHVVGDYAYRDANKGDVMQFHGVEIILFEGEEVYRLDYHGGVIKP